MFEKAKHLENEHQPLPEGDMTRAIERVTARAPSTTYLYLAGAAMLTSLGLFLAGKKEAAIFVGLWPISFLTMGNYNKIVKSLGST
jgi:hypothetical protein